MRRLLADVHAEGYLASIAQICRGPDWREVWEHIGVETLGFADLQLDATLPDAGLWEFCQANDLLLVTANRTANDPDSLAVTIRERNTPESLPVVTLANLRLFRLYRDYRERTAIGLLEICVPCAVQHDIQWMAYVDGRKPINSPKLRPLMSSSAETSSDLTWHGDARAVVDAVLGDAVSRGASDIHVEPVEDGYEVRYRIDGLLQPIASYDTDAGRAVVGRLMVLANLLTYRVDLPQEGRLTFSPHTGKDRPVDLRLAIMPTAQGLRAAVRLPAELLQPRSLEELGLPPSVLQGCWAFAAADSGMLVVTGPAGSGKTTTIYAVLQYIAEASAGLSIVTLEDPVERHLRGVTQIEVKPFGELTYERCLRSILRQDPQVLMLGEIRDAATASLALSAALSGHRMICTLHAGSPGGAIARLVEMGMEPYQISSSLIGIIAQRLVRKGSAAAGYAGRAPVAEFAPMTEDLRRAVLARSDAGTLGGAVAAGGGHIDLRQAADELVSRGITDAAEAARVLGS